MNYLKEKKPIEKKELMIDNEFNEQEIKLIQLDKLKELYKNLMKKKKEYEDIIKQYEEYLNNIQKEKEKEFELEKQRINEENNKKN